MLTVNNVVFFQNDSEVKLGNATMMVGDMFRLASFLPSDSAFDCLYADLPYNISELQHDQEENSEEKDYRFFLPTNAKIHDSNLVTPLTCDSCPFPPLPQICAPKWEE
eukprot:g19299.t1